MQFSDYNHHNITSLYYQQDQLIIIIYTRGFNFISAAYVFNKRISHI